MREKVRDRGRLEHILSAINGIMADRAIYIRTGKEQHSHILRLYQVRRGNRRGCLYAYEGVS